MIASANRFKPMTLKQVRQWLAQLPRNGHTSAKERRQRSKVAGVREVALRWIVPTLSCLDSNQPALIFPGVLVSHALQRLFLRCFSMRAPTDGGVGATRSNVIEWPWAFRITSPVRYRAATNSCQRTPPSGYRTGTR